MNHTGPEILIGTGTALTAAGLTARRRHHRKPCTSDQDRDTHRRAALRLAFDLLAGLCTAVVFAAYMLAPRQVHTYRLPMARARRMVAPMDSGTARTLIRRGGKR